MPPPAVHRMTHTAIHWGYIQYCVNAITTPVSVTGIKIIYNIEVENLLHYFVINERGVIFSLLHLSETILIITSHTRRHMHLRMAARLFEVYAHQ